MYRCAAVVLLVVVVTLLPGTGNADLTLRLVQVAHRHGARSPIVSYNTTQLCVGVPCGYLNVPGEQMMLKAGEFLRRHYNNVFSNQFFPSENYNVTLSYSRSSDVPRTLQSAAGLLHGLFPNLSAAFYSVHTVEKKRDLLLYTSNIPYVKILYELDDEWKQSVCNKWLDEIIDFNLLQDIAKEAHSEGYCAQALKRCSCAATLFDIGAAFEANGQIKSYPLLAKNLDKLRLLAQSYFATNFGHNASNKDNAKMGSKGQNIAQELLRNAELHMQGKSIYKLRHYSAHDTTLSALAGTLGDTTPEAVLPPFAQLYAFELLYDDTTNAYSMRVRRGSPGQTPDTNYAFKWDAFQLKCMDESGSVYNALDNTCLYYDFKRFIDFSKPKDPAGLCYISDRYKSLLKCPSKKEEQLNDKCRAIREVCPAWSCASGFTLDSVTLRCVCSSASCMGTGKGDGGGSFMSAASIACIALATFALGAIFFASVALLLNTWLLRCRRDSKPSVCDAV